MRLSEETTARYVEVVRRAVGWIHRNFDRILTETDIQCHYKGPYFWASTGDMARAGGHLRVFAEKLMTPDGNFRMAPDFKGFKNFPCTATNQYIYPNGWIVVGMQRLGAYDLARKGLDFMLDFQDPAHGGFYFSYDPVTGVIDKRLMDSSSTSAAGLACLACGRIREAERAGDFILKLLASQPEPDRYFYSCMRVDGSVFTDVHGKNTENQWDAEGRKQKCLSADADGGAELTWLIGKPTKFLARLYTATCKEKYLAAAKRAFAFFHKLEKGAWTNYASCKTMWAGAELYRITGDDAFAATALRILDFYAATQSESGTWVHKLWYRSEEEQSFFWTADITYEYASQISDVLFDLGRSGTHVGGVTT